MWFRICHEVQEKELTEMVLTSGKIIVDLEDEMVSFFE